MAADLSGDEFTGPEFLLGLVLASYSGRPRSECWPAARVLIETAKLSNGIELYMGTDIKEAVNGR